MEVGGADSLGLEALLEVWEYYDGAVGVLPVASVVNDEARVVAVQRHVCYGCRKTYSERSALLVFGCIGCDRVAFTQSIVCPNPHGVRASAQPGHCRSDPLRKRLRWFVCNPETQTLVAFLLPLEEVRVLQGH